MNAPHRSMELEDGHQSLSHSRRSTFRRCRRLYWLQYVAGLSTPDLPAPLRMGGIYSDGLELADPEEVSRKYSELIADAIHQGKTYLAEQMLDELAVVKPMVQTYIEHVMIPDASREIEFVGMTAHGFQDNGRMDGIVRDLPTADVITIIENKLKGRWGTAEAAALALDDQLTSYFLNASVKFGVGVDQLVARYEVAKKPALRKRVNDTPQMFRNRVTEDILSRPDFYHWVSPPITRTQEQIDEWKILFARMAEDLKDETRREFDGDPGAWPKNPDACSDYGGCSMAKICWAPSEAEATRVIQAEFVTR